MAEFEDVAFGENRTMLIYDNVENEEYPLHWHNAIEIIMPLMSSFRVLCGTEEFLLEERDVLIIPAGMPHELKAQSGRRLIMLFDSRTVSGNPALSELSEVLAAPVHIGGESDPLLRSFIGGVLRDMYILYSEPSELTEVRIYMDLLSLLVRIREDMLNSADPGGAVRYTDKFRSLLKYIDTNYMNDITLEEAADRAGYSKYHFSRTFKKYCGTTFLTYLNRRRIKAAETLLLSDEISITAAAMKSGFSSLTTFNRVFKEIKGCTPSEFRRLYSPRIK